MPYLLVGIAALGLGAGFGFSGVVKKAAVIGAITYVAVKL